MESLQATMQLIAQQQLANTQALGQLGQRVDQLAGRIDEFVFQAQRLISNQSDRLSRTEAAVESIADSVGRLTRNSEADRAAFRNYSERNDAMIDRLDRLVDYLMRQ